MSKEVNKDLWEYWDINSINNLNEEEVLSLLKSNIIPHRIRKVIRFKLHLDIIKALLPTIAIVIVAWTLTGIMKRLIKEWAKKIQGG